MSLFGKKRPYMSHTYTYLHPIDFFALPILQKLRIFIMFVFSLVRLLVLILIRAILEQSINDKTVSKIYVAMYTTDNTDIKFIVILNHALSMMVGEDSVQYRKHKKRCLLAAAILLFIGIIVIT